MLKNLEYDGIQSNGWTGDEHTDGLIQKLIMNYIRKYNAECSGEKRQDGFRAALERLGISPAQQHEILHLSADSPVCWKPP